MSSLLKKLLSIVEKDPVLNKTLPDQVDNSTVKHFMEEVKKEINKEPTSTLN